jgi:hypothetical protein
MSAPHVVIQADRKAFNPISTAAPQTAWRALGRVGLVLAVVAGFDIALRWYPLSLRSPEWEFGTVAMTFASLPLVTVGLVAGLASAMARGAKASTTAMAAVFCVMALFTIVAFLLFVSDVPLALRAVASQNAPAAMLEMKRTIARSLVMGAGFAVIYVYGSVVSLRYLLRRVKDV